MTAAQAGYVCGTAEAGRLMQEAIPMQTEEWRNEEGAVKVHSDGSKKVSTGTYAWVTKVAARLVTGAGTVGDGWGVLSSYRTALSGLLSAMVSLYDVDEKGFDLACGNMEVVRAWQDAGTATKNSGG